jgi:hypothetical protein
MNKLRILLCHVGKQIFLPVTIATLPSSLEPLEVIVAFGCCLEIGEGCFVYRRDKEVLQRLHLDYSRSVRWPTPLVRGSVHV